MPPKFGTSYSIGIKDGWISYLFSSLPLPSTQDDDDVPLSSSNRIPLPDFLRSYRPLSTNAIRHAVGHNLVYGRMYLPQSRLEALVASRVSREVNLTLRAVSSQEGDLLRPYGGATVLGLAAWDDPAGRFGIETLASTDGGVLGLRGLWNATNPPSDENHSDSKPAATLEIDKEGINGRFSAGGEIYYGLLNKSGGVSLGGRFQTLPTHHGTPLTATLTFNLLGHIRATYAVVAGDWTLASCFGFNLYSYESEWAVGIELWNRRKWHQVEAHMDDTDDTTPTDTNEVVETEMAATAPPPPIYKERSFQAKLEWRLDEDKEDEPAQEEAKTEDDFPAGILKARCDQSMRIGLLYEGRYKALLFSLGTDVDFRKLDAPFRTVGLAVQYST